jgi:hypothetical protein
VINLLEVGDYVDIIMMYSDELKEQVKYAPNATNQYIPEAYVIATIKNIKEKEG